MFIYLIFIIFFKFIAGSDSLVAPFSFGEAAEKFILWAVHSTLAVMHFSSHRGFKRGGELPRRLYRF